MAEPDAELVELVVEELVAVGVSVLVAEEVRCVDALRDTGESEVDTVGVVDGKALCADGKRGVEEG